MKELYFYSPFKINSASERSQVGIISGSWIADRAGTTREQMTEIVGHLFKIIFIDVTVVPELVILGRSACALKHTLNFL